VAAANCHELHRLETSRYAHRYAHGAARGSRVRSPSLRVTRPRAHACASARYDGSAHRGAASWSITEHWRTSGSHHLSRKCQVSRTGGCRSGNVGGRTCSGERTLGRRELRLGVGFVFSSSPGRCIVQGAASFHDDVDCVVGCPGPDHVAVRVDDGTDRRSRRGEHRDAGG
jgi:hypothetical protein